MAVVVLVLGCACSSGSTPHTATDHGGLSQHDFDLAVRLARREADAQDAHVTSATAYLKDNAGPNAPSNTGRPCTSAKVLRITLVGSFPHVAVAPPPTAGPGGGPDGSDTTVTSMSIKADERTGEPCLIGVGTGTAPPPVGAVELFTH